ncbi:uncharacterized protein LOC113375720 [Ctenocephalides felis]|uniref:uncharacterized protein LOC113375720 n=1 Tax=Ctenocephalides felis TaxID=7515 RepID=UPI000E6E2210|nr:uncharacterized protein LOC113375720 [Ctenocephalides felis]
MNNLRTYIPKYLVVRQGIIFDVDINLSEDEIMEVIESDYPVVEVKCLKSKRGNNINYKLQCVKLTFRGSKLPEKISIYSVKCRVSPYIKKVVQCHNCWFFGHIKEQCKSKKRCPKCSEQHGLEACTEILNLRCCLCSGEHVANSTECPEFKRHKNIYELMGTHNIAFHEARHILRNDKYSRVVKFNPYTIDKEKDFPTIKEKRRDEYGLEKSYCDKNKYNELSKLIEEEKDTEEEDIVWIRKPKRSHVKNVTRVGGQGTSKVSKYNNINNETDIKRVSNREIISRKRPIKTSEDNTDQEGNESRKEENDPLEILKQLVTQIILINRSDDSSINRLLSIVMSKLEKDKRTTGS